MDYLLSSNFLLWNSVIFWKECDVVCLAERCWVNYIEQQVWVCGLIKEERERERKTAEDIVKFLFNLVRSELTSDPLIRKQSSKLIKSTKWIACNMFFQCTNPGLFLFIFGLFKQTNNTILQQISVKNVHVYSAGIRTHDLSNLSRLP